MLRFSALRSTLRRYALALLPALAITALCAGSASADLIVIAGNVTVVPGSTNNPIEVTLTNTGPSAVHLDAFAFEVSVANTNITFNLADINTTTAPYIFAGQSLFGPVISTTPPGQVLDASDNYAVAGSDITLASGATLALGRLLFDVAPAAAAAVVPVLINTDPAITNLADKGQNVAINSFVNGSITINSAVPEPTSLILLGLGIIGLRRSWSGKRDEALSESVSPRS